MTETVQPPSNPQQSFPAVDISKFNAADITKKILMLRAKMKEIKARHTEELKDFVELEAKLQGHMIAFLMQTRQLNAKNENGTPYLSRKVTYSVQDQQEFRRHVIGTESWDLLVWGCAKEAADAFVMEHKQPPPGVKRTSLVTLGVTSPPKPKTKVADSPQPTMTPIVPIQEVESL